MLRYRSLIMCTMALTCYAGPEEERSIKREVIVHIAPEAVTAAKEREKRIETIGKCATISVTLCLLCAAPLVPYLWSKWLEYAH